MRVWVQREVKQLLCIRNLYDISFVDNTDTVGNEPNDGKVMSNIIVLDANGLGLTPGEYCGKAAEKGLLIKPVLKDKVRLVFYRDISREDTEKAVAIIRELDSLR